MHASHSLTDSNGESRGDDRIGVYLPYNSDPSISPVRYVGRFEDLQSRLKDWTSDYRYFEYECHPNITDAYKHEADLYHDNGRQKEPR